MQEIIKSRVERQHPPVSSPRAGATVPPCTGARPWRYQWRDL